MIFVEEKGQVNFAVFIDIPLKTGEKMNENGLLLTFFAKMFEHFVVLIKSVLRSNWKRNFWIEFKVTLFFSFFLQIFRFLHKKTNLIFWLFVSFFSLFFINFDLKQKLIEKN